MSDNFRSIALSGIERHSGWLKTSSDQIERYVRMLGARPEYETKAEAAMGDAEKALVEALEKLRKERRRFQKLKVEEKKRGKAAGWVGPL